MRIHLRKVQQDDISFIFVLANDEDVRAMSFHSEKIDWETHKRWFAGQLRRENPFYVVCLNEEPCGYVRMENDADLANDEVKVGIALAPQCRGRNIAAAALLEACHDVLTTTDNKKIWAYVKADNGPSIKTFLRAHFREVEPQEILGHACRCFVYPGYEEQV